MSAADSGPDAAIPFREWMRRALFDPRAGYYSRNIRAVGRRGDFSTAPGVGDALGEAVAGWLAEELKAAPAVRTVIEAGGGDGTLLRTVRRALGFFRRRRLQFFMVESSPVLRARQEDALRGARVAWFGDMDSALDACGGGAFIFHNELLDAFPVTLAEWDGRSWREIWMGRQGGRWVEQPRDLDLGEGERAGFSALAAGGGEAPRRVELGTAARDWLRGWAPHWREGAMLTLDYGDECPRLYERRPRGTLRAYLAHQRVEGAAVYENMGRQDVTADVNFTDLAQLGEELGWRASDLQTQREFLRRHLRRFEERMARDATLQFLADEHGVGTAYKALVQRARR